VAVMGPMAGRRRKCRIRIGCRPSRPGAAARWPERWCAGPPRTAGAARPPWGAAHPAATGLSRSCRPGRRRYDASDSRGGRPRDTILGLISPTRGRRHPARPSAGRAARRSRGSRRAAGAARPTRPPPGSVRCSAAASPATARGRRGELGGAQVGGHLPHPHPCGPAAGWPHRRAGPVVGSGELGHGGRVGWPRRTTLGRGLFPCHRSATERHVSARRFGPYTAAAPHSRSATGCCACSTTTGSGNAPLIATGLACHEAAFNLLAAPISTTTSYPVVLAPLLPAGIVSGLAFPTTASATQRRSTGAGRDRQRPGRHRPPDRPRARRHRGRRDVHQPRRLHHRDPVTDGLPPALLVLAAMPPRPRHCSGGGPATGRARSYPDV